MMNTKQSHQARSLRTGERCGALGSSVQPGPRRRSLRHARSESGIAMLETAIVIPVVALLLFALIEFGLAFARYQVVTNAAREGARMAAVANPLTTTASVDSMVRNVLVQGGLNGYASTTQVTIGGWRGGVGTPDSVRVDYPYQFLLLGPIIGWTTGQRTVTLTSQSIMRNE